MWEDSMGQGVCRGGQLVSDFRKGKRMLCLFILLFYFFSNGDWTSCLAHLVERSTAEPNIWEECTPSLLQTQNNNPPEINSLLWACLPRCNQGVTSGEKTVVPLPEAATWNSRFLKLQGRRRLRAEATILTGCHRVSVWTLPGAESHGEC